MRAGRRRSSRRRPTVTGATLVEQHGHRAAHRRQLQPERQGPDRAEGLLGPLLQQPRGRLLVGESGRHQLRRVQLPRPEPQQPLRRAVGAGRAAAPHRRRDVDRQSGPEDAVHRRDQRLAGAPVLGRVVGAVHLRPQEPVRFRAVLLPRRWSRRGRGRSPFRRALSTAAKRSTCSTSRRRLPTRRIPRSTTGRTATSTTTPSSSRSTSGSATASSSRPASITSGATSCASADISNFGNDQPARHRSDRRSGRS